MERHSDKGSKATPHRLTTKKATTTKKQNKKPDNIRRHPPLDVRITTEGTQYLMFAKDKVYHASLDELGEIVQGDFYFGHAADLELDIYPSVRWGKGYKQRHSRHPIPSPQHVLASRLQDTARPTHGAPPHTHVQRAQIKIPFGP
jgi:hypothetical protein